MDEYFSKTTIRLECWFLSERCIKQFCDFYYMPLRTRDDSCFAPEQEQILLGKTLSLSQVVMNIIGYCGLFHLRKTRSDTRHWLRENNACMCEHGNHQQKAEGKRKYLKKANDVIASPRSRLRMITEHADANVERLS